MKGTGIYQILEYIGKYFKTPSSGAIKHFAKTWEIITLYQEVLPKIKDWEITLLSKFFENCIQETLVTSQKESVTVKVMKELLSKETIHLIEKGQLLSRLFRVPKKGWNI